MSDLKVSELAPCPFCGESERLHEEKIGADPDLPYDCIRCGQCDAEGPIAGYGRTWNTRAPDASLTLEVAQLKQALGKIAEGSSLYEAWRVARAALKESLPHVR